MKIINNWYVFLESKKDDNLIPKPKAIFQEKKNDKFVGYKIYYYETKDPRWWFVTVGKPCKKILEYDDDNSGQWTSKRDYKTIKSLEEYHKDDNIFRIDNLKNS